MSYPGFLRVTEPVPPHCPTCGDPYRYDPLKGCLFCDAGWRSDEPSGLFDAFEFPEPRDAGRIAKDLAVAGLCIAALGVLTPAMFVLETAKLFTAAVSRRLEERA